MLMYVYMWCMMYIISIPPPQLDAGRLLILQSAGGKIIHVAWKGNHKFHDCKGNLNHLWIISEFLKLSETNKSWDISPNRGNWAKKGYSSDEPICSMYINIINKRKTPIVSGAMKIPWKSHENPMKTPIKHGTPGPKNRVNDQLSPAAPWTCGTHSDRWFYLAEFRGWRCWVG